MHITPVPHESEVPHRQPPGPQLSARCASHAAQRPPPVPHWLVVPGDRHVFPLQQPCAHEVLSQTQALLKQRWPAPHEGELPHWQAPVPQLLALVRLQDWHCAPEVPHSEVVRAVTQVPAEQHPLAQEVGSHTHTLPRQRVPAAQAAWLPQRQPPVSQLSAAVGLQLAQVAPPLPQAEVESAKTQVLPWQQPTQL